MKVFRLKLNEKRNCIGYEGSHERFLEAENRDSAYDKSLKIAATFFDDYKDAPTGIPDKDFIFWFNGDYVAIWIDGLEEIEIM